ncbi:MAG: phosphate signaling complex protein PhoU [Anaerolineales bacterium]|jgi:phosphate transport system protein|nr:phosphate signaling complex protein PhoU [Anaerolineales bacterium]
MSKRTRARYDQNYAAIEGDILKMGSLVQDAIRNSIESLKQRDTNLAQDVIDRDLRINDLRFKIEEACLTLIATQQPTAGDLRAVVAAMNIVVDMERMADHASGIAKTVIRMGDEPLLKPLIDLPRMADIAREMLSDSLDAFYKRDASAAKAIAPRDVEMDLLYNAIFDELVEIMAHKPGSVERATYLLWCAHNLERIGDRAINIVERVVFMTTGDMRELTF